jgi:hypothetical protein
MLFPQLGPQYYDENKRGVLALMESFYAESITINQSFWGEADNDTRMWQGDQTFFNDQFGNVPVNRRKQFTFNRIRRVVNMVSGYQRKNRKSTVVTPIENGDAETADQFTKILMWINQHEGVLETISESFEGSLVTGMNLLHVWMDYRTDPVSGNIRVDNCNYNSYLIDPYFRKTDLSDCRAIWKRSFLTKREAISLLPGQADEVLGLQGLDSGTGRDGKFQFMPESYNYGMKNLLTYDEFWYRDYRTQKVICDPQTGEIMEWPGSTNDEQLKLYMQTYPNLVMLEQEIPTVRLAIVVQGRVFYDGPNPMGVDQYPFVPVFSYYAPQLPYFPTRVKGIVRDLVSAQYLYNRRKVIELDILESQINSGFIYKENALVNPKDVWQLSGQGRGLALKEEANMTDVIQIQAPQIPPSMIELSKIMGEEIQNIAGVNEELLGSAVDDKAGILSMLRQGAGLTTLQGLFDNLDYAQKLLGNLMLNLIQANFTPGKVQKILEGQQPAPQFYSKAFGKYGCAIEEGFNTTTQKQMQFAQLLQLRELGVPIPDEALLDAAIIQDKKKLLEAINAQKQQAQQMQQMQLEATLKEQNARTELAKSRSVADQGLGLERLSRVKENQALAEERTAAAEKDHYMAILDLIRGAKELEGIDINHIETLVRVADMMKSREQASLSELRPSGDQQLIQANQV